MVGRPGTIVFVHGLFSSGAIWKAFDEMLAADPDLAALRCLHFSYPSPKLSLSPLRRIPEFDDLADELATFLEMETDGQEPLILVSHSQGGLIIQRFLARQLSKGRGLALARSGTLCCSPARTRGLSSPTRCGAECGPSGDTRRRASWRR